MRRRFESCRPHLSRLRSSTRQSCRLLIGGLQVRLLPGPLLEGLPLARYPASKTGAASAVGGSTPSPSVFVPARSNGYDARLLIAKSRFEPCRRSSLIGGWCPWRHGSLIPSRAWFDSRTSDLFHAPVVERRRRRVLSPEARVRVPPGVPLHSRLAVGERPPRRFREPETAGSTPAGQTFVAR